MKKKVGRPATGKQTQVMRINRKTYDRLKAMKGKLTFDELFDEVFEARRLINDASKVFEINGKLLRGFTILQARELSKLFSADTSAGRLRILLDIGADE